MPQAKSMIFTTHKATAISVLATLNSALNRPQAKKSILLQTNLQAANISVLAKNKMDLLPEIILRAIKVHLQTMELL
jgi:hypothetical protein